MVHSNDIAECRIKTFKKGAANRKVTLAMRLALELARVSDATYAKHRRGWLPRHNEYDQIVVVATKQDDIGSTSA